MGPQHRQGQDGMGRWWGHWHEIDNPQKQPTEGWETVKPLQDKEDPPPWEAADWEDPCKRKEGEALGHKERKPEGGQTPGGGVNTA
jgi:hypothetical protein